MIKLILLAALACVSVSRASGLADIDVLLAIGIGGGGGGCQDVDAIDRTLRDVSTKPPNPSTFK